LPLNIPRITASGSTRGMEPSAHDVYVDSFGAFFVDMIVVGFISALSIGPIALLSRSISGASGSYTRHPQQGLKGLGVVGVVAHRHVVTPASVTRRPRR
jgi:hypothetical protein